MVLSGLVEDPDESGRSSPDVSGSIAAAYRDPLAGLFANVPPGDDRPHDVPLHPIGGNVYICPGVVIFQNGIKEPSEDMVFFKSCPRCSGDRILEHDVYGWYILCLACGYVTYPNVRMRTVHATREARKDRMAEVPNGAHPRPHVPVGLL